MSSVIAIVPARGGSKGVPGKNSRPLAGFPLIAYSILAGLHCPAIDRVIVSTDSPEIAALGRAYGAEVPFLRPAALAGDTSSDREYVLHCLDWLAAHEGAEPDLVVQLRPTTPLRDPDVVGRAVMALAADTAATSLRSAHPLPEPPQKMMGIDADGRFVGLFPHDPRPEYYNLPRQAFPPAYNCNGYVDIVRSAFVRGSGAFYGPRVHAFVTDPAVEVDTGRDFDLLEYLMDRGGHPLRDLLARHPGPRSTETS